MTLRNVPATPLPWNSNAAVSDDYSVHPQDFEYYVHTGNHYPLMVGALKSGAVVPAYLDSMRAEDLRKFIREQADVATQTLRAIGEAD
jgi:hypothetical protein